MISQLLNTTNSSVLHTLNHKLQPSPHINKDFEDDNLITKNRKFLRVMKILKLQKVSKKYRLELFKVLSLS